MKKNFIIFRHGQTDWNLERRCQGHTDIPLNETGLKQAEALAQRLKSYPLEIVYSSDLKRAIKTGEFVTDALKINLVQDSRLREVDIGKAGGLLIDEAKEKYGVDLWQTFRFVNEEVMDLRFPDGENRKEVVERMKSLVNDILDENQHNWIGLSTHGAALRSFLHSFLPDGSPPLEIPNCVAYQLSLENGQWSVEGPI